MDDFLQLAHPGVLHFARARLVQVFMDITKKWREFQIDRRRGFLSYFEDDFAVGKRRGSAGPYAELALVSPAFVDLMSPDVAHEEPLFEDVLGFAL